MRTREISIQYQYYILNYVYIYNSHIDTYLTKHIFKHHLFQLSISHTCHDTINVHNQLSHNSNVTRCKVCDAMHVVPKCEPNVSPLSDSISRIQATLPI